MDLVQQCQVKALSFDSKTRRHLEMPVAVEFPIALIYNGISHVVMMALPEDLIDFAYGFSLSEGIIDSPHEIYHIEVIHQPLGIEIHIELCSRQFQALKQQRRQLAGRTGCGLCGTEQLEHIRKPQKKLPLTSTLTQFDFKKANALLSRAQKIGQLTHSTHAAIWLSLKGDWIAGFEDIGRHVALDKILGFRSKQKVQHGIILVSSRASYEMVQKAVQCNVEFLFALSATTTLAVELAKAANLTLIASLKQEYPIVYSGTERILFNSLSF